MQGEFRKVRRQCLVVKAFFKAIFFMCSQSVVHSLNDEQYIKKNRRFIESNTFYHNIHQAVA